MIDLKQHHDSFNDLTQFGQAGVLHKIFNVIGTTNKFFVEFGSDGTESGQGNSCCLRSLGFDGVLMDGQNRENSRYKVYQHFITKENINNLFEMYNIPEIFDFLSIDIDQNDFYVWQNLDKKYRPRVLSIESNCHFPKDVDSVPPYIPNYTWNWSGTSGSSAKAIYNLCKIKNYSYVAHCGSDGIYIADEVIKEKKELFKDINNFDEIFPGPIFNLLNPPEQNLSSKDLLKSNENFS